MNLNVKDVFVIFMSCLLAILLTVLLVGNLYTDCVKDGLDLVQCWEK